MLSLTILQTICSNRPSLCSLTCGQSASVSFTASRPQFYLSPKSFSFQWFCNQLLITTLSSPVLIGFPVANISSFTLYAISLFNESMTPILQPCLGLPLGPSKALDITTARWWKMSLLVLIQFDICRYGSSEAQTKMVTEAGSIRLICCFVSLSLCLIFSQSFFHMVGS